MREYVLLVFCLLLLGFPHQVVLTKALRIVGFCVGFSNNGVPT